jgi:hypothetical protein
MRSAAEPIGNNGDRNNGFAGGLNWFSKDGFSAG